MNAQFSLGTQEVTNQDLDQARSAQALRVLKDKAQNADGARIDKAAKDFESILLAEWLEKAETSFATVPGADSENTDPGHDQFQSIGCQFLSQALTKAGGIGLASMISKSLRATEAARATAARGHESNQGHPLKPDGNAESSIQVTHK